MAMRKSTGLAAGLILTVASAAASAAPPSTQQVHQLMQIVGMGRMLSQMNTQMAVLMQRSLPCVPSSYWQGFVDANTSQQLIDRMVPVYQKHFTSQDIAGLLAFYRSPLGQKVIREMPQTMAEGMRIGREWGQQRGRQMIEQLKRNGTLTDKGQCPAAPAASKPAISKK